MKGLYFYKLETPNRPQNVTKDCKLTVTEIDSNFCALQDADIKDVSFNKETNSISLTRNDGEVLIIDLSPMVEGITTDLDVVYDDKEGKIVVSYNGQKVIINGLLTQENIGKTVLTEVISDGTLDGLGSKRIPLGIASVEKTGTYKPAIRLLDEGEKLPPKDMLKKGDRYVCLESISDYV